MPEDTVLMICRKGPDAVGVIGGDLVSFRHNSPRATAYLLRVLQVIEPVVIPEAGKISGTVMAKKAGTK